MFTVGKLAILLTLFSKFCWMIKSVPGKNLTSPSFCGCPLLNTKVALCLHLYIAGYTITASFSAITFSTENKKSYSTVYDLSKAFKEKKTCSIRRLKDWRDSQSIIMCTAVSFHPPHPPPTHRNRRSKEGNSVSSFIYCPRPIWNGYIHYQTDLGCEDSAI